MMKKVMLFTVLIVMFSMFAYADLSDFPDNFIHDGRFDGYIVVGADGTAVDVVSQGNLGSALADYMNKPIIGINMLDTDVDLDSNLVLIGNPCVNNLTAALYDYPEPCDKGYPDGVAFIKYVEKDDNIYIVAAGNNDLGSKKAMDRLVEFNSLFGRELVVEVEPAKETYKERRDAKNPPKEEEPEEEAEEVPPAPTLISEPEEKDSDTGGEENNGTVEEEGQEKTVVVEEKNIIAKVWDWFKGLFG